MGWHALNRTRERWSIASRHGRQGNGSTACHRGGGGGGTKSMDPRITEGSVSPGKLSNSPKPGYKDRKANDASSSIREDCCRRGRMVSCAGRRPRGAERPQQQTQCGPHRRLGPRPGSLRCACGRERGRAVRRERKPFSRSPQAVSQSSRLMWTGGSASTRRASTPWSSARRITRMRSSPTGR